MQANQTKGIRTQVTLVTPKMARDWLEKNNNNRAVRDAHIARLATDMKNGQWFFTHQGIAFNCDGSLLDGQHRLHAIVRAETPQYMMVTRGLPVKAMTAVDDHQRRSVSDALKVAHDIDMRSKKRTTAAAMWLYHGCKTFRAKRTKQEQVTFYLEHAEALDWAVAALPTTAKGLGRASVLGAIARAYYTQDRGKILRFCQVVTDGLPKNKNEETVVKLRDVLLAGGRGEGGWSTGSDIYKKTARTLVAFIKGEHLSKIYQITEEPFLIPGEPGYKATAK